MQLPKSFGWDYHNERTPIDWKDWIIPTIVVIVVILWALSQRGNDGCEVIGKTESGEKVTYCDPDHGREYDYPAG